MTGFHPANPNVMALLIAIALALIIWSLDSMVEVVTSERKTQAEILSRLATLEERIKECTND